MSGLWIKTIRFKRFFLAAAVLLLVFAACDLPMGLGDPVDTTAPLITILAPESNSVLRGIQMGMPFDMYGTLEDDIGVTSLEFKLTRKSSNAIVIPDKLSYRIYSDGTWDASITILNDEVIEYNIRVFAYDSFKNEGADEVDVRIEVVPPWVDRASIYRTSNPAAVQTINVDEPVDVLESYRTRGIFDDSEAYRTIMNNEMYLFQNESFTLKLEIKPLQNFEVGGTRLYILDDHGQYVNTDFRPGDTLNGDDLNPDFFNDGLSPVSSNDNRTHEWEITHDMLVEKNQSFDSGPSYISFEIWAWNTASWDERNDRPVPESEGGISRVQRITGTCWYPESDYPHIYFSRDEGSGNILTLQPDDDTALLVDFYDDDSISEIYLGLILKTDVDTLLNNESEEAFIQSLAVNESRREEVINLLDLKNRLAEPQSASKSEWLATGESGEYRLIALVKEKKDDNPNWSVYPFLRVEVQDLAAAIIIVENPIRENIFPDLTDGRKFTMSGYTLSQDEMREIKIAWVPGPIDVTSQARAEAVLTGAVDINDTNIVVWEPQITNTSTQVIGGTTFTKIDWKLELDIINDFIPGGESNFENANKFLVIYANNGAPGTKTFRLSEWKTGPSVSVDRINYHDNSEALVLHMTVTSSRGIAIEPESYVITDITSDDDNDDDIFDGPVVYNNNTGFWERTVPETVVKGYQEGSVRTYRFYVTDILGNSSVPVERAITMSDKPVLEAINCANGSGSYGIGTELRFEASFSMSVKTVSQGVLKPKLKLYTSDHGGSADIYADYYSTAGGTVIFTYTVQPGDKTDKLLTLENPIENNHLIYSTNNVQSVLSPDYTPLQDYAEVALDGVRPQIIRASFAQKTGETSGSSYFNNGKTVTLKIYTDKPVRVSGNPSTLITYDNSSNTIQATYTRTTTEGAYNVLNFNTSVLNLENVSETRLEWSGQFTSGRDNITDEVGNSLGDSNPTDADLYGGSGLSGFPVEQAYIKTTTPPVPTFNLFRNDNGDGEFTGTGAVLTNRQNVYLRVSGAETDASLYYSSEGGNNGQIIFGGSYVPITDPNYANRFLTTYTAASFAVTAWQEDRAGNRSGNADTRSITINSRAPELTSFDIAVPDAIYPAGRQITFNFNFSRRVTTAAGATVTIGLAGRTITGTIDIPSLSLTGSNTSMLTAVWTIAGDASNIMQNIKAVNIQFTGVSDEYGNSLARYYGSAAEASGQPNRPISDDSSFQMNRPNLGIRPVGPNLLSADPALPTASGNGSNGGVLPSGSRTIRLTFDTAVEAVAGKTITIRPWGNWAIPPVLSIEEFNTLYNYAFENDRAEYRRRLSDIDGNGLPNVGAQPGNANGYNSYVKNTHGVTNIGGRVRPDTTTKYVLDFNTDLYTGSPADNLRELFNAARWKWQTILAASGSVTYENNKATVVINLNEALDPGRIWEVTVEAGAFQDAAGTTSLPINANDYRFWSAGTATPVIRTERVSYDTNINGNPTREWGATGISRPEIDIRVRIDCETPGAEIRYDVVRTAIQPAVGSALFTSTANTDAAFFGSDLGISVPGTRLEAFASLGPGYSRNTIGDEYPIANYLDENRFFLRLLVPNNVETGTGFGTSGTAIQNTTIASSPNGTIDYNDFATLGTSLQSWGTINIAASQRQYQTINAATGAASPASQGDSWFICIGEAYPADNNTAPSRTASGDTDTKLFSGRRDYIAAVARKINVTSGEAAGTQHDVSGIGMEGVYKTTLLYRNPGRRNYNSQNNPPNETLTYTTGRLLVQGFDQPITPVVAGFPLRDADANSSDQNSYNNYFSKSAYRLGGTVGTGTNGQNSNNYIWVTWEIVTDWYQKGKIFSAGTTGNYLSNGGDTANYNAITATYGGIIYRYQQSYY